MSEIKKKVIELGLKNAIVIRTNIDPFKINDPDMEQVRGSGDVENEQIKLIIL